MHFLSRHAFAQLRLLLACHNVYFTLTVIAGTGITLRGAAVESPYKQRAGYFLATVLLPLGTAATASYFWLLLAAAWQPCWLLLGTASYFWLPCGIGRPRLPTINAESRDIVSHVDAHRHSTVWSSICAALQAYPLPLPPHYQHFHGSVMLWVNAPTCESPPCLPCTYMTDKHGAPRTASLAALLPASLLTT